MFGPPSTTAIDLSAASSNSEAVRGQSASSDSSSSSFSRRSSEISAPIKHKPMPLRLQPSEAEIRRSTMSNAGGSYIPPPQTKDTQSQPNSFGVHFGRPSVIESPPIRAQSDDELSQLQYEGEVPRSFMFLAGQHSSVRSQAGSIYGSAEISPSNLAGIPKMPTPPAPTHVFGFPQVHQRPRSISPEEPPSNESSPSPNFPVPSIPSPYKKSYQPTTLQHDSGTNTKRRSYQPTNQFEPQLEELHYNHDREPSLAPSTITARTSILDEPSSHPRPRSEHPLNSNPAPRGRPTHKKTHSNSSITHTKQHNHVQISRTHDSIRLSHKSSQGQNHRLSKDRDQIYYDPTSRPSARTRSGSVQGRAVDFDRPRESPFSNSNAILGGSSGESFSSASSVSTGGSRDSSREGRGRGRSESVGEMEANDGGWNHRRGRSIVGDTIVEVLTPMTSRGERFDASHMV